MIEENAIVLSSSDGVARVKTQRSATCGGCSARTGCGTAMLTRVFGNRRAIFQVLDPLDAKPGDKVVIGIDETMLVKASLVLYMLPLMALILGAGAGQFGAQGAGVLSEELGSILGGCAGLLGGLDWVRRKSRRFQADGRYKAVILRPVNQLFVDHPRRPDRADG